MNNLYAMIIQIDSIFLPLYDNTLLCLMHGGVNFRPFGQPRHVLLVHAFRSFDVYFRNQQTYSCLRITL